MKIVKISKSDFEKNESIKLFEDKLTDRVFVVIKFNSLSFKFAWQSESVNPLLLNIKEKIYLIGIDLNLCFFDSSNAKIILNIKLDYFFYDAKIYRDDIYIITELEILKINKLTLKIDEKYYLPSFFEEIVFNEDRIVVNCIDGEFLVI